MAFFDRAPTGSPFVNSRRFIEKVWLDWWKTSDLGAIIQDTRANRATYAAADYTNRFYFESDTKLTYLSNGTLWKYYSGSYDRTQAQIAAFIATLTIDDTGLLIVVTDFTHILKWGGAALDFAPGDDGSNYFLDAPSAPLGKTVQLCDGTATTYLKADGTTAAYVTRNLNGHYRKSVTAGADATVAAVAPLFVGTAAVLTGAVAAPVFTGTAATLTGNVAAPTFTGNAATLTGNVAAPVFTGTPGTTGTPSATANIGAGAANASSSSHTHSFTPAGTNNAPALTMNSYTPGGTNSAPALTMNSYTPQGTLNAPALTMNSYTPQGTIGTTGEPATYKVLTYFRR